MNNPYQAPDSAPANPTHAAYQPRFLSLSGRIGRLRYIAYYTGLTLLAYPVMLAIFLMSGVFRGESLGLFGIIVLGALYIALLVMTIGYTVRRLNDIDQSGWLALLMLIPLVNLILVLVLLFASGTSGSNRFGGAPVANTKGVVVLSCLPLLFLALGIVAALALPAYQSYALGERAQYDQRLQELQQQLQAYDE